MSAVEETPLLSARGVSVTFDTAGGPANVTRRVSFDVAPGQTVALVGESGSGKTTVLRCLAGQYRHWSGELSIAGVPLQHKLSKEHFRKVQMVFQDPYGSLHPRHTIDTALREPLIIHGVGDMYEMLIDLFMYLGFYDCLIYGFAV